VPVTPLVVAPPSPATFEVVVKRSARRTRSTAARLVGETLHVTIPGWMSADEERHWVEEWRRRFRRKVATDRLDLGERAVSLARRYDLPTPARIVWVDTMHTRWGSCTPATRSIRISAAVARFPDWVLDYVIVHELAHLAVPDHSARFWSLVARYPRTERARGYLVAKAGTIDDEADQPDVVGPPA
jgi:predicted metal-dependent hydrolase